MKGRTKNRKTAVFCVLLAFALILTAGSTAYADDPDFVNVCIGNKYLAFSPGEGAIVLNGRTLVPIRAVSEALGAQVGWDQKKQEVSINGNGKSISLTIDSTNAYVNGDLYTLDAPAAVVNGRTLVPLRFIGEAFGNSVKWDEKSRTAYVEILGQTASTPPEPRLLPASAPGPSSDRSGNDVSSVDDSKRSIQERKAIFERLYNQAKPFTGVPITAFAPKLKLPNNFKGAIVQEIDVETLRNTSGGLRMGDLKYGGTIYSDLQIFPEENRIQIQVTDVSLFAGPGVYLLDDSNNLWRRDPPLRKYNNMKHYTFYHITDDAEAELRGLPPLDIKKNVTHILIQFGEEFIAVKNLLYERK